MTSAPDDRSQFETRVAQLTRTQKQVIDLFLKGCDDETIARSLEIETSTVRQHLSRIANTLNIPADPMDKGFRRRQIAQLFQRFSPAHIP